eukprot:TRINITY_DN5742_c0_g1_i3.p3 TRINITY_DN5742_c0_g1~~TRINITY_DN5742_c0_g1_i3.p3  ORF type:complete len:150 (-),score=14.89 TRINITY_DN5742_c0_g1_i3:745-1194(-)
MQQESKSDIQSSYSGQVWSLVSTSSFSSYMQGPTLEEQVQQNGESAALSLEVALTQMVNEPIVGLQHVTDQLISYQVNAEGGIKAGLKLRRDLNNSKKQAQFCSEGCGLSMNALDSMGDTNTRKLKMVMEDVKRSLAAVQLLHSRSASK